MLSNGEQSCEFSQKFGFGSSYTFLIPSTLFSTEVCNLPQHVSYIDPICCLLVFMCMCVLVCVQCTSIKAVEDMQPNLVHMALQIPQYFLITTGEVMFSVTGLQFSYSQVS